MPDEFLRYQSCTNPFMAVSLALVHHANQYLITTGYDNREDISDIVGSERKRTGILGALAIHENLGIPLNLHISGTLLESIAWHCPKALQQIRNYIKDGLIELAGSSYGQNIMRFFGPEYNRRQLNELLRLYELLLDVSPAQVKVFWPPERVWETRRMAPALRDANLLNEGYRYVILDDRTLLSPRDSDLPRAVYDQDTPWEPRLFQPLEIEHGLGLIALPIGIRLRHSIPPKKESDWKQVQTELETLLVHSANSADNNYLALYADDMEKVIGVWGKDGPKRYGRLLQWVSRNSWIQPVKLSEWAAANPPTDRQPIETGTFAELAREFKAGEGYENWFYSDDWKPYRDYFQRTEQRVKECKAMPADTSLIELAEKQLLVSNWETAWHTPATGAHGNPVEHGKPSPWAKALSSHCRHALATAEAALWMNERDGRAHALQSDIDLDDEAELVLKNDRFFAVVNPESGGRVTALYLSGSDRGAMVVGNPCDDWNFLEDLHGFMQKPRNHPGAFADVGFEDDRYECEIVAEGERAVVQLTNGERGSPAYSLRKIYEFDANDASLVVRYSLPPVLKKLSVECALSPDYLTLLRFGSDVLNPIRTRSGRGFAANGFSIILEAQSGLKWGKPAQEWIGHARTLRLSTKRREFVLRLRMHAAVARRTEEAA